MNDVYVAVVTTEAHDQYTFVFKNDTDRSTIAKMVWELEGECEDLEFYEDTIYINYDLYGVIE